MNDLSVPTHIGFIVDGNRRWAKQHGLPSYEGHMAGYNVLQDIIRAVLDAGVKYVSAYVFSTENWKRSQDEVGRLMGMILRVLTTDLHIFSENNIRLVVMGSRQNLDKKILEAIEKAEALTADNTAGTVALCFNYGGQLEIVDAVKNIIDSGTKSSDLTPELINQNMYHPDVPALDLVVRTSGEHRLSNFLLWRVAYSEMIFLDKMWPDMTHDDVRAILDEYAKRSRRFGA
jgi:undecaprenyl diphosphate synthase